MIPLCVPNLAGKEADYLAECVRTTFVSTVGAYVTTFEDHVAEAAGTKLAIATSAGTTALHAAYVAAGVKYGDLVVAPSLTFIATVNAISHAGALPWLMDCDRESWTLSVAQLKHALHTETARNSDGELIHQPSGRRVSAITPVFCMGTPADMDEIAQLAKEYDLKLIVDGAAALGGTYKGKLTGQLGADLTMYSFNGNKIITCGGGGAVAGDDEELINHFRHLTTTARVGADYTHDEIGFNYRMTNVQAALGCAQMEKRDDYYAAKRNIAATYADAFKDIPGVAPFPVPADRESACWFSGFYFTETTGASQSESLRAYLRNCKIDARPFWKPAHQQRPYMDAPREEMTVSDSIWETVVTLPCSSHLTSQEQQTVIDSVHRWFDEK